MTKPTCLTCSGKIADDQEIEAVGGKGRSAGQIRYRHLNWDDCRTELASIRPAVTALRTDNDGRVRPHPTLDDMERR